MKNIVAFFNLRVGRVEEFAEKRQGFLRCASILDGLRVAGGAVVRDGWG